MRLRTQKFIEELPTSTNLYSGYAQSNNFPYFRYAEILLNYAEAKTSLFRLLISLCTMQWMKYVKELD